MEPADSPYHVHGVSNGLDAPGVSLDESLRRIAEARLNFAPGQGWGYSMAIDVLTLLEAMRRGAPPPPGARPGPRRATLSAAHRRRGADPGAGLGLGLGLRLRRR